MSRNFVKQEHNKLVTKNSILKTIWEIESMELRIKLKTTTIESIESLGVSLVMYHNTGYFF